MREDNECNIFQQQATFLISLNNYDKRALTVTDLGPLTHSLLNLAYLSASSPQKISSLLIGDGGLVLLIKKLSRLKYPAQKLPYSAILSILANLIIRGNSVFRFMCFSLNIIKPLSQLLKESLPVDVPLKNAHTESTFQRIGGSTGIVPIRGPLEERGPLEIPDRNVTEMIGNFDDVVLVIKIIAYLSKYQEIRYKLHMWEEGNIFQLIEPFTLLSESFPEIRKWAIIAMRNAFKRDPNSSGLRRCGNLECAKWEITYREFSKCSRCRRVVYCCKECQRVSWPLHRNWCLLDLSKSQKLISRDVVSSNQDNSILFNSNQDLDNSTLLNSNQEI